MRKTLLIVIVTVAFAAPLYAQGQYVRLQNKGITGTIDSTDDDDVIVLDSKDVGAFGSVKIQTKDSYLGTWEVQCSVSGSDSDFNADDELGMVRNGTTTVVYNVTDVIGIWTVVDAAGCRKIRVVPTAGFSGSDTVMVAEATQSGGGGSSGGAGGGGGTFDGVLLEEADGDPVTDTTATAIRFLQVDTNGDAFVFATDYLVGEAIADWTLEGGTITICRASSGKPTAQTADDAQALWCGLSGETIIMGDIPHDGVDAGNPLLQGARAIAHGTNPTAVAAADRTVTYANRAGIPFVIGGHPNVQRIEIQEQDADNGQTDTAIVTCGAGCKVVVTAASATCDPDTTDDTGIRLGFGAATLPAAADTPVAGIVLSHDGVPPGGGISYSGAAGMYATGADGEDLRLTIGDPAGGSCNILVTYYTIES